MLSCSLCLFARLFVFFYTILNENYSCGNILSVCIGNEFGVFLHIFYIEAN